MQEAAAELRHGSAAQFQPLQHLQRPQHCAFGATSVAVQNLYLTSLPRGEGVTLLGSQSARSACVSQAACHVYTKWNDMTSRWVLRQAQKAYLPRWQCSNCALLVFESLLSLSKDRPDDAITPGLPDVQEVGPPQWQC